MKRNTALVLGNVGSAAAVPALVKALSDPEPLVRGHAAGALGRIGSLTALESRPKARTTTEGSGSATAPSEPG